MILKTSAIPLYFTDVSNTSRMVTWLTADAGKLSTIIKGEQRKNSLFRGQYDLFSTSELVFYDRTDRGTHIAKECSLLHRRPVFRRSWRACASAGYIAALFAKTTPRHAHEPERFEFFEEMLSHAEEAGHHQAFLTWFDLHFAEFMGHRLQLDDADRSRDAYRFAADHGGLVEPGYASRHRIPATPLSPEAVSILKQWQTELVPDCVLQSHIKPTIQQQIDRVFEKFSAHHYDLPPHVRQTAVQILQTVPAP